MLFVVIGKEPVKVGRRDGKPHDGNPRLDLIQRKALPVIVLIRRAALGAYANHAARKLLAGKEVRQKLRRGR
jgi:hypothetical protein